MIGGFEEDILFDNNRYHIFIIPTVMHYFFMTKNLETMHTSFLLPGQATDPCNMPTSHILGKLSTFH